MMYIRIQSCDLTVTHGLTVSTGPQRLATTHQKRSFLTMNYVMSHRYTFKTYLDINVNYVMLIYVVTI